MRKGEKSEALLCLAQRTGAGFMRLIDLDEEVGELRVQTFSPGIPQSPDPRYRTDWQSQFTIPIDWESRFDVILEPEPWEPWIPEPPNTTLSPSPAAV